MARIDPLRARAILTVAGCNLEDDFHALHSWKVEALEIQANAYGYRKPPSANGSRLRYWHAYLVRQARKSLGESV